jgi:hypothetical protein
MLQVTHLGWQSWLIGADQTALLIDPVFGESVGRAAAPMRQRIPCWPPRLFEIAALQPIDAVVLTHEHEDHFDIPSLDRLDRRVPLWLSERSSRAARTILAEMGFDVLPLRPGERTSIGGLDLLPLSSGHAGLECFADEWDVVAPFIAAPGSGNFFTNVDAPVTPHLLDQVAQAHAAGQISTLVCLSGKLGLFGRLNSTPAPAAAVRTSDEALRALGEGQGIRPNAGNTFIMRGGAPVEWRPSIAAVRTPPEAHWPPCPAFWPEQGRPGLPATGRTTVTNAEFDELRAGLQQIADWMFGGPLFRWLLALTPGQRHGRRGTVTWFLLNGEGEDGPRRHGFEYVPQEGGFVPAADPSGSVGVVVSWASDLLALFRGEVEPRTLTKHGSEQWQLKPAENLRMPFTQWILWPFFHPLRQPGACLAQYRRLLATAEPSARASIPARTQHREHARAI